MFCSNCGFQVNENMRFCPNCGQAVRTPAAQTPAPVRESSSPVRESSAPSPIPVLIWGILGIAFAVSGGLGILGSIFSIVGLCQARRYYADGGKPCRQAVIGRNLSIAGLIAGIVLTILFVLYIIFMSGLFRSFIQMAERYM